MTWLARLKRYLGWESMKKERIAPHPDVDEEEEAGLGGEGSQRERRLPPGRVRKDGRPRGVEAADEHIIHYYYYHYYFFGG